MHDIAKVIARYACRDSLAVGEFANVIPDYEMAHGYEIAQAHEPNHDKEDGRSRMASQEARALLLAPQRSLAQNADIVSS